MDKQLVAHILDRAIKRVDKQWGQGHQLPEKYCLWYALQDGAYGRDLSALGSERTEAYVAAMDLVVQQLGDVHVIRSKRFGSSTVLIQWNDQDGRTKVEVLTALRAAQQASLL